MVAYPDQKPNNKGGRCFQNCRYTDLGRAGKQMPGCLQQIRILATVKYITTKMSNYVIPNKLIFRLYNLLQCFFFSRIKVGCLSGLFLHHFYLLIYLTEFSLLLKYALCPHSCGLIRNKIQTKTTLTKSGIS